jgi:predicted kinase
VILSPDALLLHPDGRYEWSPDRAYRAWMASMRALAEVLPRCTHLVLMVGLPGAGKTTWLAAQAADLDPLILYFDATLTRRMDRSPLLQAALRADRPVDAVWHDTPVAVCRARNSVRPVERRVPDAAFEAMVRRITAPAIGEGFRTVTRVFD